MSQLDEARRLCRELGGPGVDLWSLPGRSVERAQRTGRPLLEAVRIVVSGWLAARARTGDAPSLDRLLQIWHVEVQRWCRWNATPGTDPEDAAHDVLVRAVERLGRLDRPEGFQAWLWAITWRVLREHGRRAWRRGWLDRRVAVHPSSGDPPVVEELEAHERAQQVQAVLALLDIDDRVVLWHAYIEGRTRPQISDLLGWPEGTVNRRLTRARTRFRTLARRRGLTPLDDDAREQA